MPSQKWMSGAISALFASLTVALALSSPIVGQQPPGDDVLGQNIGFSELKTAWPGVRGFDEIDGRVTRLFGAPFGGGASAEQAAADFIQQHADIWGVQPQQLLPIGPFPNGQHTTPMMLDDRTGTYRFTGVHYAQHVGNVPVFRARLSLLARNEPGSPLVLASADLRNLSGFKAPTMPLPKINHTNLTTDAAPKVGDGAVILSSRHVIFAGVDDQPAPATLGIEYITELSLPGIYEKWLFVIDARTGATLYEEDQVLEAEITGNVSALVADGMNASVCHPLVAQPLPYARIAIGGTVAFADVNGNYTIDDGGAGGLVTVESGVRGQFFRVFNQAEPDSLLMQDVTAPTVADFFYDASTAVTPEYVQAELDAYLHANIVRDFVLSVNPAYPIIGGQTEWPVNVNINANCNAFYNGGSINFYIAGGNCNNTAFGGVVYHEYGHHLVNVGGSGQGQYGEGMSDCVALLLTNDSQLGRGFRDCAVGIRNADNSFQYPCTGEVHFCGNLISGCVWSLREELQVTEPANYNDILANLTLNSILMHTGTLITPQITLDFLTLDDDNANIFDGTPHFEEIMAAFQDHNMTPDLPLLTFSFPNGLPSVIHPAAGATIRVEVLPDNGTPMPGTGMFHYDDGGGAVSVPMSIVSDNVYDAAIPPVDCGAIVNFSFSAEATIDFVQVYPTPSSGALLSIRAATVMVDQFSDDLEADAGWVVTNTAGLLDGAWTRGVPAGDGNRGDPTLDGDGSGQCFLTDNVAGNSDVDNGATILTSPVMDASASNTVAYWRWYSNTVGDNPFQDVFLVEVSDNAGATWNFLEQVGPNMPDVNGGWSFVEHNLLAIEEFTPNNQFMIRFIASDTDPQSVVEAAVDGITLRDVNCTPLSPGDINGDGIVNVSDLLVLLAAWGPCQPAAPCWQDTNNDGVINVTDLLAVLANWG